VTRRRLASKFLLTGLPAVLLFPLFAQNFDEIQAEQLIDHLKYGDGVVWSRDGFLLFSDVGANRIYRLDAGAEKAKTGRENAGGAEGLGEDAQGRLYVCESRNRRVTRTDRKGGIDAIAERFEGKKLNAPNDITIRKDGQVYFTDPAFGSDIDHRELDFNGIFHLNPKGELSAVARWKTRPNGIALSPDGRTLYVSDSDRHAVAAFDVDGRGDASNQRDLITGISGVPGGIRVDASGKIYVAARGLGIYSREGKREHLLLESDITTNCAFGDADFETLYVMSREKLFRLRLGVKGAAQ
jgi:gluconolactonase